MLNPETITILDPACGSGHILVEAYDLLKQIYLEAGYRLRDIPRLILEKNLYGLDIDDRAAQLAGFALLMKARADDRRLLDNPPRLNVLAIQDSKGFNLDDLTDHLKPFGIDRATLALLLDIFAEAKTFGSLIQIPEALDLALPGLVDGLQQAAKSGDMFAQSLAAELVPLVWQAWIMAMKYDSVVANPPYMGNKAICGKLKNFLNRNYLGFDRDLFSSFILRNTKYTKLGGFVGFVSSFVWMYISTYQPVRELITMECGLESLIQLDYDAYEDAKAHLCTFIYRKYSLKDFIGLYINLDGFKGSVMQAPKTLEAIHKKDVPWRFLTNSLKFDMIPGKPIAFWVDDAIANAFIENPPFSYQCISVKGLDTCDNAKFVRRWFEVSLDKVNFNAQRIDDTVESVRWFPYSKGGFYRKWYGNNEFIVDWFNNGEILRSLRDDSGKIKSRPQSTDRYFTNGINFSAITSAEFSARIMQRAIFGGGGNAVFSNNILITIGFLNSKVCSLMTKVLNPTLNILVGDILRLPYKIKYDRQSEIEETVENLISIARNDWARLETAWEFLRLGWLSSDGITDTLELSWSRWDDACKESILLSTKLENKINELFLYEYRLTGVISIETDSSKTPFVRADRFRDCRSLVSYAIGCMLGRYSLDEPGLIYAHAGNIGFDITRYKTFLADIDGILPITDEHWFDDDAAQRIREFLLAVWGPETLDENMAWLAESLGPKNDETLQETIRRYLSANFFKDHLKTYKKRPIYWLFSSGKQGAFQALVYLHRYNESTLARMRNQYVIPLTGKIAGRIDFLEQEVANAASTSARTKAQKALDAMRKKQTELAAYDEQLRHYADLRISLDLDDGVKVNYGKFGNLLAEVKAVTGGSGDD
jgi:type II restriction/modification system DNA methylase subunit YeeA